MHVCAHIIEMDEKTKSGGKNIAETEDRKFDDEILKAEDPESGVGRELPSSLRMKTKQKLMSQP